MKINLFGKKNKDKTAKAEQPVEVQAVEETDTNVKELGPNASSDAYRILKSFYLTEKSTRLGIFNQYVFKVYPGANKKEIKKHVGRLYNVKVKDVKVLNMPEKRRDIGRHPGFKSGYRKAIVVLEKGQTIEQAKP